ncbi:helix-turn-helix transcriptional regulator [Cryobacterium sp. PH31-L1]|uniref:helix-turn-helix transcriptional regulator n=1 Tax=Cryobacterium sp. PH31-L1 TaxID=3046199 RepID=UPI0024BB0279|nr:helix-turn-helix transcriptional regulator [Cryobacterium sp. PH31-L1]MDJ0376264.1 helix-turn-helix transcriptional regulator [Cryobacterium sp. PH31-L1]
MKNTVRDERERHKWTQAHLAAQLQVSRQTIIAIERERFDPSLRLAFALSATLGVEITTLFTPDLERTSP